MQALRAGASGFLGKGVEPMELLEAIRVIAAGEALLSPRATRAMSKLDARDRAQLVVLAFQSGLVRP